MISVVFVHEDGYKFEERFTTKSQFRRTYNRYAKNGKATFLHAADLTAGIAVYPANVWGYLRS